MTAEFFQQVDTCVDAIIDRVGPELRVGVPLGAGKPNVLLNALYDRVAADPSMSLTIFTALTLQRPGGMSLLEQRFFGPFAERVFGNYPDLNYEAARTGAGLPDNIRVVEFYFPPGKFKDNPSAQSNYISSNYTHVARDLVRYGVNVLMQLVAARGTGDGMVLSLGSNPDVAPDVMRDLRQQERMGQPCAFVAQTTDEMPFMYGDAEVGPDEFHFVLDNRELDYRLFGPPKMPVTDADHLIGLYVSCLIRDGGELQVGIGSIGDAVVHSLLLRHQQNNTWRQVHDALGTWDRFLQVIEDCGGRDIFDKGLFVASEMMIDGFLDLIDAGIVKREVYDDIYLQRLLNEGRITEDVNLGTLDQLLQVRGIGNPLTPSDVEYLKLFGILREDVVWQDRMLRLPDGSTVECDVLDSTVRSELERKALGDRLTNGAFMHAGFFLGPQAFYQRLRDMPESVRQRIRMQSVRKVNQLFGNEELDLLHRTDARSVNTAMMHTLLGAAVSDALADGRTISGVGGQYNFVAMAHELPGGRSVINLRSVRGEGADAQSNIVWNYGHVTIPRHLRDIVVTEYGIADLRGRTDAEVVQQMLSVCDSRFQDELRLQAVNAGKLSADFRIPERHRQNRPERYARVLEQNRTDFVFHRFPLGCDFTDEELVIAAALKRLKKKTATSGGKLATIGRALSRGGAGPDVAAFMERMNLTSPSTGAERLYARLLAAEIRQG